ncbi:unnamed protein product [Cuscuta campestris]|uniref:DUF4216 domain-containing protein n=1 Tax=Cuscuta campestris TaxID=132261 RepID=A0A484LA48_9ASTE|nr:unnamed protein product [Cuscuta campestris]
MSIHYVTQILTLLMRLYFCKWNKVLHHGLKNMLGKLLIHRKLFVMYQGDLYPSSAHTQFVMSMVIAFTLRLTVPNVPRLTAHCVVFKCKWYDPRPRVGTRVHDKYDLVEVLKSEIFRKYEPFILATQAKQVAYVEYPGVASRAKGEWLAVCGVKPRGRVETTSDTQKLKSTDNFAYQEDARVVVEIVEVEPHEEAPLLAEFPQLIDLDDSEDEESDDVEILITTDESSSENIKRHIGQRICECIKQRISASARASARASGTATVRVPTGHHSTNVTSTSSGGFTRSTDESRMHDDESMDSDESIEHEHGDAMDLGPSVAYFDRSGSVVFTEEGARIICSTFQQRLDPTGGSWKSLSDATVDFYWREFQKHATWDPRIDDSVMFRVWRSKARRRYTDWLSSIRNEKKGTEKVQPLVPQSWKEKSPKFLASTKQNKKNRCGGDENAPASATHTGGPLSFRETQTRLGKSGKASDLGKKCKFELKQPFYKEIGEEKEIDKYRVTNLLKKMNKLKNWSLKKPPLVAGASATAAVVERRRAVVNRRLHLLRWVASIAAARAAALLFLYDSPHTLF